MDAAAELKNVANEKLGRYVHRLEKMTPEELKREWYKTHDHGRAPEYDQTRLLNEIVRTWEEIMGGLLSKAKVPDDLPDEPGTPPGDRWVRS